MTVHTRIAEDVERAIRAVTDNTTGHYNAKAARQEIRDRLIRGEFHWDDPERGDIFENDIAAKYERQYLSARKPRTENDTLFDPTAVLPLGGGDRVFMDDATADDLAQWAKLSHTNRKRVEAADDRTQQYAIERITELRAHPGWKLGRIERELHDWTWDYAEAEEPGDDADDM